MDEIQEPDDIVDRLRENADLDAMEHVPADIVQMQRDAVEEIVRLRCALRWYGDEAVALAANTAAKKDMAILASAQVLALDAGKRANDVLLKTPNVR